MVGRHLGTYIGFWADPGDAKWAEAEAEQRGVSKSRVLAEALSDYRAKQDPAAQDEKEGQQS